MSPHNKQPVTGYPAIFPDIPDNLTIALAVCQDVSVVRAAPEIGVSVSAVRHVTAPSCWSRGRSGSRKASGRSSYLHTTPKIRVRFRGCKHTSLTWLAEASQKVEVLGSRAYSKPGEKYCI
jgi:hypothetical protein